MDKMKIIKIVIAVLILISSVIYYLISNNYDYDELSVNNIIVNTANSEQNVEKNTIKVYITGEIKNSGVIEIEEGARIDDVIKNSGGITENANLNDINLAYEVSDGEKIYIPSINEEYSYEQENNYEQESNKKININKATETDLMQINGIGESTAQKIIEYREKNGKFNDIEDLKNVSGIGESKYEKIKEFITVK